MKKILLLNNNLRKELSENAINKIKKKFKKNNLEYLKLYKRLLKL